MDLFDSRYEHDAYTETVTNIILRRVRGASEKVGWNKRILQLAWTAGPVTYLALQGGYLIGYGKHAPADLFIYFAGYTLIAGIVALIFSFLYHLTRGGDADEDRRSLERVFGLLPDRLIEIRDLQLKLHDEEERRILGAKYLLENPDAGGDTVLAAIMDLTADKELAEAIRDIEVYRRNGLLARAHEKGIEIENRLGRYKEKLSAVSEEVLRLVTDRAAGLAPSKRVGRRRTRGFIGRVLAAHEADNLNLMSLVDAEEMYVLVYELICARRFPLIEIRHFGDREYTERARRLTQCRRDYRTAVYVRNGRLRVLAEALDQLKETSLGGRFRQKKKVGGARRLIASVPQIRSAKLLQNIITEQLLAILKEQEELHNKQSREAKERAKRIRVLTELYTQLGKAAQRVERCYNDFQKAWDQYALMLQKREGKTVCLLKNNNKGRGVKLQLKRIGLETSQILPVARITEEVLEEYSHINEMCEVQANDQKELAVDLIQILERFIALDDPQVQRAIESTNSAYLICLEHDFTNSIKEHWGLALVSEVQTRVQEVIHETIRNLVEFDRLKLEEEDIDYLVKRFGADPEFLREQIIIERNRSEFDFKFNVAEPIPVPPLKRSSQK